MSAASRIPSPSSTELPSVRTLAEQLRFGAVSAREVVEQHIRRIEEVEPTLHALAVARFAEAREEAAAADRAQAEGRPLGALHGVPVTIKESFDVAGLPTTWGLSARAGARAEADDPLVARLRAAGAIVLGKTNVPQLLLSDETDNPVYGRTNHPLAPDERSPGGSSGGEAALIAAGGSPLGLGTDFGGSIRVPAHACGIHGLRTTPGLLPMTAPAGITHLPRVTSRIASAGPLARHVDDLVLALQVLTAGGERPLGDVGALPVAGLQVGLFTDDGLFPVAPALRRVCEEAARALVDRGVEVVPLEVPDPGEVLEVFLGGISLEGAAGLLRTMAGSTWAPATQTMRQALAMPQPVRAVVPFVLELLGQERTARVLRSLRPRAGREREELLARRDALQRRFLQQLDDKGIDAVLGPPAALPALRHGAHAKLGVCGIYAILFNLLQLPAGSLAAGRVRAGEESDRPATRDRVDQAARWVEMGSSGLPVSVQVAARPFRDDLVLRLLGVLEEHFRATEEYPLR